MGTYGTHPGEYTVTNINEVLFHLFLFFLLMSAYYLYLRFVVRRSKMIIDNDEHEIGDEIDYRFHCNVLSYGFRIRKVSDTEWMAYKRFRSGRRVSLRKGLLRKIVNYMNGNFGYNDEVIGL